MSSTIRIYHSNKQVFRREDCKLETLEQLFCEIEKHLDIKRGTYRLYWDRVELNHPDDFISDYWGNRPAVLTIEPVFSWNFLWTGLFPRFRSRYQPLDTNSVDN